MTYLTIYLKRNDHLSYSGMPPAASIWTIKNTKYVAQYNSLGENWIETSHLWLLAHQFWANRCLENESWDALLLQILLIVYHSIPSSTTTYAFTMGPNYAISLFLTYNNPEAPLEIKTFETSGDSPLGFCPGLSSLKVFISGSRCAGIAKAHNFFCKPFYINFDIHNLTPISTWVASTAPDFKTVTSRKNKVMFILHESESSNLERHLL